MARRTIHVEGETWNIYPSGRVTQYTRDEFGLVFEKGTGRERVRRVMRYSPLGAKRPDQALAELSAARLVEFFHQSQPAWMSPETRYDRTGS